MNRLEPPVRMSGVCSCCKKFRTVFLPRGILAKKFDQLCGQCYGIIARERHQQEPQSRPEQQRGGRPFLTLYQCLRCRAELASPLHYSSCYLCRGPIKSRRIYS